MTMNNNLLFEFNDTNKIKIGNDLHLINKEHAVDALLVAIEECNINIKTTGTFYCKINGQNYSFYNKMENDNIDEEELIWDGIANISLIN